MYTTKFGFNFQAAYKMVFALSWPLIYTNSSFLLIRAIIYTLLLSSSASLTPQFGQGCTQIPLYLTSEPAEHPQYRHSTSLLQTQLEYILFHHPHEPPTSFAHNDDSVQVCTIFHI
ncbi:hypothetical protein VPH35_137045 [Triticum aestivum]|uniref:Uncharacterized protein n=1 Tax=Aegilops tauschii subsp. strangulata TaxID=200361 RepID=A0A453RLP4_AEGTS